MAEFSEMSLDKKFQNERAKLSSTSKRREILGRALYLGKKTPLLHQTFRVPLKWRNPQLYKLYG